MPTYTQKPIEFEAVQLTNDESLILLVGWFGKSPTSVERTYPQNAIISATFPALALGGGDFVVRQGEYVTALGSNFTTTSADLFEAQFEEVEN